MQKITSFLMFTGQAEEAMTFYTSLFHDSKVERIARYGPGEGGPEGTVMHAVFTLNGQQLMCIDSPVQHAFTFTPSMSLWVDCTSDAEVDKLFEALSNGGQVMMPLGAYPFSERYAWLSDRFGVSWQLSYNRKS